MALKDVLSWLRTMRDIDAVTTLEDHGNGSGSALNRGILISAGICAFVATFISTLSIWLQLKNYRRPILQRQVVRIMLMIPIYAISSFISLYSLDAAVAIDAFRDIYEAFVIYNFFHLLLDYLGGERSLLILLHGRPPKRHVFPVTLIKQELDVSDPFTFLFLKRGILQYVQIKPILAVVTLILKATGTYREGNFRADAGYLYVSIVYNISVCVALYCLAMFWVVINDDVKPFRPMPKFLCIKGILFFCFWQSITISFLVSPLHLITHIGPYTDVEHISIAITDVLICYEMPLFAIAHTFAFSHRDYIDPLTHYAARMRFWSALKDAFGLKDVVIDAQQTFHSNVTYRTYEPVEGGMHVGAGRDRRIRAGLRYAKGGKQKYWLPMPADDEMVAPAVTGPLTAVQRRWDQHRGYVALPAEAAEDVVHEGWQEDDPNAPRSPPGAFEPDYTATDEDGLDLHFDPPEEDQLLEVTFMESKKLVFGDYNYPVIDVSTETARIAMWDEEERILRGERSAWNGGSSGFQGYGATGTTTQASTSKAKQRKSKEPDWDKAMEHPATIDYANETVPDIDIKGIRLKWTKGAPVPTRQESSASTSSKRSATNPRTSTTDSFKRGMDKLERRRSSPAKSPKPEHVPDPNELDSDEEAVAERDDAVDLVVEDKKAAELEMEWERRRGEPAIAESSGLKKVYKRKYVIEDDEGSDDEGKEVEIDETRPGAGEEPDDLPEKVKVKIQDRNMEQRTEGMSAASTSESGPHLSKWNEGKDGILSPGSGTEVKITREIAPPPHARLEIKHDLDDAENPWR